MNALKLFVILLFPLGILSCKSDDENVEFNIDDPNLIGIWSFDSVVIHNNDSVLLDMDSITKGHVNLTINNDGTVKSGILYNGTYKINDSQGRIDFNIGRSDLSGVPTPRWITIMMNSLNETETYRINGLQLELKNEFQTAYFSKIQE